MTHISCEPTRLTEWDKCIEFLDNLHCTSKQCVLPHMPTVIPLFTCVNIDYTSKMGGACLCLGDAGIWTIFLKLLREM
jgi:hypothetical protein